MRQLFCLGLCCFSTFLIAETVARLLIFNAHPPLSHSKDFDSKYFLATSKSKVQKHHILLLGDSLMAYGLYADLLALRFSEHGNSVDVRNLAVPGNTPNMSLFLLKTALAAGAKPDAVFFDVSLPHYNQHNLQSLYWGKKEIFYQSYLGSCQASPQTSPACQLQRYSYLFRYRHFFKEQLLMLGDLWFHPKSIMAFQTADHVVSEISPDGWAPNYTLFKKSSFIQHFQANDVTLKNEKIVSAFVNFRWTEQAVSPLFTYCKKNHIPLILIWLPEHPVREGIYQHFHLSTKAFSKKVANMAQHWKFTYLDLHQADPNYTHYYNSSHLNILGALSATEELSKQLLKQAPKSRTLDFMTLSK